MRINEKYTNMQVIFLVLLRVLIGWHFLYEGIAKLLKPEWSAQGFLLQSKWIFSGLFHWMAQDPGVLSVVNFLNIWGLILIGLALILGIFSRFASVAGVALILLYYLCNPPFIGLYYSMPSEGNYMIVNKNLVELGGLLVLAVFPTGRMAGLDHILHKWITIRKS